LVVKHVADCCLHEIVFFVLVAIKLVRVRAWVGGRYEWGGRQVHIEARLLEVGLLGLVVVKVAGVVFKLIPLIIKIPAFVVVRLVVKVLHLLIQHLLLELLHLHLLLVLEILLHLEVDDVFLTQLKQGGRLVWNE
jgi:hypothetical protein